AMTLADRIVVMNQRRIEQVGTPPQVYDSPATLFVATFVGSPAMNILPVTRAAERGTMQRVRLGDGAELATAVPRTDVPAAGELRLGLRPESIKLCPLGEGDARA